MGKPGQNLFTLIISCEYIPIHLVTNCSPLHCGKVSKAKCLNSFSYFLYITNNYTFP